jgi:hypothetical protein
MSAQKHTQGKLLARGYSIYSNDKTPVADTCLTASHPDMDHANALRLVACWNACDGLSTEELEQAPTKDTFLSALHAIRQRDELLCRIEAAKNIWREDTERIAEIIKDRDLLCTALRSLLSVFAPDSAEHEVVLAREALYKATGGNT